MLHTFALTNSEGAFPRQVDELDGTLYGAATEGGISGNGTLFAMNTDGTSFRVLHSFSTISGVGPGGYVNSDGVGVASLIRAFSGDTVYGATYEGGGWGSGTVFAVNSDGTGFRTLYQFSGSSDGANPSGLILLTDFWGETNTLYGTASSGGAAGEGTIFALNEDGSEFKTLHSSSAGNTNSPGGINMDGRVPRNGLVSRGFTLYGTASFGGGNGGGTIFAVNTDGTGFTVLHTFSRSPGAWDWPINADGIEPEQLVWSDGAFCGTKSLGGNLRGGVIFSFSFRPQLTISRLKSDVILAWPLSYSGFDYSGYALESTTDLASAQWTTNATAPLLVEGQVTVRTPTSNAQQFFRLRR